MTKYNVSAMHKLGFQAQTLYAHAMLVYKHTAQVMPLTDKVGLHAVLFIDIIEAQEFMFVECLKER